MSGARPWQGTLSASALAGPGENPEGLFVAGLAGKRQFSQEWWRTTNTLDARPCS